MQRGPRRTESPDTSPRYRRNELSAANVSKRQAYLFEIGQLDQAKAIIIRCDEKAYHVGGTPNQHVTLPINRISCQSRAPTRFLWQSEDFDETVRGKVCRAAYVELAKRCKMAAGATTSKMISISIEMRVGLWDANGCIMCLTKSSFPTADKWPTALPYRTEMLCRWHVQEATRR